MCLIFPFRSELPRGVGTTLDSFLCPDGTKHGDYHIMKVKQVLMR